MSRTSPTSLVVFCTVIILPSGTGKEYIYPTDDPSRPALESFLRGSGDEHKTAFVPFKPKSEVDVKGCATLYQLAKKKMLRVE